MKKLGTIIGVSESTVSLYESGKRQPDFATATKIAEYFQVSLDFLLGIEDSLGIATKGIKIPVLGTVAAGIPIDAIEDIIDYEEIPEAVAKQGEYFGLKIKGSSMEPRIKEDDVVIVKKQESVDNGDIAIVMVNGNEATCKKVSKQPSGITLIPLNPSYEPIFYSNEEINTLPVRILGKVVELRAKF
jgi:repressor LexA